SEERGGTQEAYLLEDEGGRDNVSANQRDLQVQVQRIHGMGVVELDVEAIQQRLNERLELFMEVVRNDKATEEIKSGTHDAAAQLIEVLHQAHARKLGAMGHRF